MTAPLIDDLLSKRRLSVVKAAEPEREREAGEHVLEGEGFTPSSAPVDPERMRDLIVTGLRTIYDPEIPLNIYDLGLINSIDVTPEGVVALQMTLTAPGCPVAGSLVAEVQERLVQTPGVRRASTRLVWDPPWTQERLSDAAKLELGLL